MSVNIEQKEALIKKIENTDNKFLIDEIVRLIGTEINEELYQTNEAQKSAVRESRRQIEKGEVLSEREANEKTDRWLKNSLD